MFCHSSVYDRRQWLADLKSPAPPRMGGRVIDDVVLILCFKRYSWIKIFLYQFNSSIIIKVINWLYFSSRFRRLGLKFLGSVMQFCGCYLVRWSLSLVIDWFEVQSLAVFCERLQRTSSTNSRMNSAKRSRDVLCFWRYESKTGVWSYDW